ncbi:hypothetical protein D3C81_1809120 [compost metagenome]
MGQPGPVVVPGAGAEHLGFALQSAEGGGADETAVVPLVFVAVVAGFIFIAHNADCAQLHRRVLLAARWNQA